MKKIVVKKPRKKIDNEESRIQKTCIKWFDLQYPQYSQILFAIPNGGKRNVVTASIMKKEGVRRRVLDIFFAKEKIRTLSGVICNEYYGLFIEIKTKEGKLSKEQKEFIKKVEAERFKCEICRSLDEFIKIINEYLN